MRYTTTLTLIGLGVLATAGEAAAFGRGGYAYRGAAVGPRGGAAYGGSQGRAVSGPYGAAAGGSRGGTYTGPRGTTVQAGRAGGVATGPAGGVHAAGASGVKVTTPSGQTYDKGRAGAATVGPAGGVRAGGVAGASTSGPYGSAGVARRGGVAVGPAGGAVAGGARAGYVSSPWGGYSAGGVRVGAVGHTTGYLSPAYVRSSAVVVRTGNRYPYFTPTWYTRHTAAWVAPRWVAPVWVAPTWPVVASFVGVTAPPVSYDYGSSTVIQDDTVYQNGDPAGSAADYATQATTLADTGRAAKPADADEWQPLGVFGLIQEGETVAQRIFQLGVNRGGVVRGNYYDAVADTTQPVYGSVDKATQRVAWSIGEKKDITFQAGLNTLTQNEGTVLVHYGKERTQQMMLVRLEEPKDAKQ